MNICVVSPFPLYQPPYSYVGAFEAWWKPLSLRHNIFAISSKIAGISPSKYVCGSRIQDIRIPAAFFSKIPYVVPDPIKMLKRLIEIDRRCGIDLVHGIKIMFIPAFYAAIFAKKVLRKPLIASIHGAYEYTPGKLVSLMARGYRETVAKITLSLADKVVVLTPSLSSFARKMGLPETKLECIPIGPDLKRFHPKNKRETRRKLGLPPNKFIVLYLGSLKLIKGVHFLLKAAEGVLKAQSELIFIFAGEGPLKRKLIQETEKKHKEAFLFPGYIHNSEEYLAAADILVLPSLSEGLPMVLLEAQAMGRVAIATNVGGVSDVIKDKENGLLLKPGDIKNLERSILELVDKKQLIEKMGKKGRRMIQNRFNPKILSERIESLYESAIKA